MSSGSDPKQPRPNPGESAQRPADFPPPLSERLAEMAAGGASNRGETVAAERPPQRIIVQHTSGSRLGRLLAYVGWGGFAICGILLIGQSLLLSDYLDTSDGLTERHVSGPALQKNRVALIEIEGMLVEGDGYVKQQIDRVRDDKSVKAVVVRVNSPGGTISASDYIYHHLKKLREERDIPIVVSMGSIAASGGYYLSMAVGDEKDVIFAEPTSTTGSIGVIIPHYDVSGLMAEYNVKDDSIVSHERKQMLAMTRPIPPEHREILQAYVGEAFGRFKDIVKDGRPAFQKDPAALDALATGEIFSAERAKEVGLIDQIGFQEEAIARAIELAELNEDQVSVIRYEAPFSLTSALGLAKSRSQALDSNALFEAATPRAYYLFTSLPPLVTSNR